MATNYELLKSVRLTGRITTAGQLEIITRRNENELVEALDIKSDGPPTVRIELHDFPHEGDTWQFQATAPWHRDTSPYAWAEFDAYTDGEAFDTLPLVAHPAGSTEAAQEKPKSIFIKIEPVVDAPDQS